MICTKCGARLMETDQFCSKCGARVIKEKRCPDCGELLRDNVRFCPGCGRAVGVRRSKAAVSDETLDIPIEAIERNILSETAAEIKAERRTQPAPRRSTAGAAAVKKQASVPAPPPRKKKPVYREEVWEDDDWEDEDDEDDDDWDDDWDDEDEGIDAITIMTVAAGCILLIVVAVLGFHLYRQYVPRNYGNAAEQEEEAGRQDGQEEQEPSEQDGEDGGSQEQTAGISGGTSRLTIESNVNVRDRPGTSGTNVLKVAKAGETYACNGHTEDGDWYEIVLEDGTVGYVFQEYVSVE